MSVRKRGDRWVAIAELGRDPVTGKRMQDWLGTFASEEDALAAERAALVDYARGRYVKPSKLLVRDYLADWLAARDHPGGLSYLSAKKYESHIRNHITPVIGHIELGKLTPRDITRVFQTIRANGGSEQTVRFAYSVLRAALNDGVRLQEIAVNPTNATKPPKKPTREYVWWTVPQARHFFTVHAGHPMLPIWRLAIYTGLRRGEIFGLRWSDVDLDDGVLRVRQTLIRDTIGKWRFGAPKGGEGRTVVLALPAQASLREQRARQAEQRLTAGDNWHDFDLVFTRADGTPLHMDNAYEQFQRMAAEAGLPQVRIHDLRHTTATLLRSMGMDMKVLQMMLGHKSLAMTMDLYSHVEVEEQRAAVERLSAALDG